MRFGNGYTLAAALAALLLVSLASMPPSQADPTAGPHSRTDTLGARASKTWRTTFNGGEWADVKAVTTESDDCDIDLKVYDLNGRLVASDLDDDGVPECRWFVSSAYDTRVYRTEVINCEGHSEEYRITFF